MTKRSMSEVVVGLAKEVPVGSLIRPHSESQSYKGVPDLVAARGIVRGVLSSNPQFASLLALRDVARIYTPNHGFGGQVAALWDADNRELFTGVSPEVKRLAAELAERQDGVVGYIHSVKEDSFESQEIYSGPDGFRSQTAVRVVGSYALTYDHLTDMFGQGLQELADPLSNPVIERDIRTIYASGVLAMGNI
ncbi:MAG TPA: hypothetical protein VLG16_00530 [Candidatus Saccharimonadales bacterium]|nr:hypothetical protein [Candidatus Saccharimonadales bacterium]